MNRLFTYSLILLISLAAQFSYAQKGALEESLSKINKLLNGIAEVSMKKESLVVKFTKNNELYRQDKVLVADLNSKKVEYVAEENSVVLRCYSDREGCVFRQLLLKKRKNYYSRLNIIMKGKESAVADLTKEFEKFIVLHQEN